ncbi:SDR family NAD(P)-dependent oxidoreductase [Pseudonocardia sp. NPDC049635]|uniref:SDR family oxidoreductase n=1 Tax=Pseudonocardia sp. NPDC049635 TaxID=3155506 RepID=UPI0033FE2D6D
MTTATTPPPATPGRDPGRSPLAGRRVLVSGASAGIGEATARALAARGARVGLLARRADRLDELAGELAGSVAVPVDLTDDDAVVPAVGATIAALGGLDAVVHAAGVFHAGEVVPASGGDPVVSPQQWRRMFDLNVVALLVLTRAAAPHLEVGVDPAVVSISSMSGRRVPTAAGAVYAASKHAVHAVSEGLRMELAPRGVRVTTVSPGFVRTGLVDDWPPGPLRDRYSERLAAVGLDPAVVADAVVHVLVSPAQVVEYALTSVTQ